MYGAPETIRTSDRLVRSQVLYPAELRALGVAYYHHCQLISQPFFTDPLWRQGKYIPELPIIIGHVVGPPFRVAKACWKSAPGKLFMPWVFHITCG